MAESIGAGDTTTQCVARQTLGVIALLTGHGRRQPRPPHRGDGLGRVGPLARTALPRPRQVAGTLPARTRRPRRGVSRRRQRTQTRRTARREEPSPGAVPDRRDHPLHRRTLGRRARRARSGHGHHRRHRQPQLRPPVRSGPRHDRHPSRRPLRRARTTCKPGSATSRPAWHSSGRTGCSPPRPNGSPPPDNTTPH